VTEVALSMGYAVVCDLWVYGIPGRIPPLFRALGRGYRADN